MSVSPGQAVSAAVVNTAFGSKISDNTYVGVQTLNTPSSGPQIDNVQLDLNNAKTVTYTVESIASSGTVTVSATGGGIQYRRVQSTGGAVVVNSVPFGASHGLSDGQQVRLVGVDDTNTLEFNTNDAADGMLLNGDAVLQKGYILDVQYDSILDRFLETGRNF